MERIKKYGVKIHTGCTIEEFLEDGVSYTEGDFQAWLMGYDAIVLAMGVSSYNPLEETARNLVDEVHVIGDAKNVSKILSATLQATEAAQAI